MIAGGAQSGTFCIDNILVLWWISVIPGPMEACSERYAIEGRCCDSWSETLVAGGDRSDSSGGVAPYKSGVAKYTSVQTKSKNPRRQRTREHFRERTGISDPAPNALSARELNYKSGMGPRMAHLLLDIRR